MGILYDIFNTTKKHCTMCGCIMDPNSKNDLCECCLDDLNDIDREENFEKC